MKKARVGFDMHDNTQKQHIFSKNFKPVYGFISG